MTTYVLYVGTEKDSHGRIIDASRLESAREFAECYTAQTFGGYSIMDYFGGWVNDTGVLIRERSLRFDVITDAPIAVVWAWANTVRNYFRQDSVLLTSYRLQSSALVETEVMAA